MTSQQYKIEIQKIIEELPEKQLSEALDYLKSLKVLSVQDMITAKNISKILREDKDVLKKLAQ